MTAESYLDKASFRGSGKASPERRHFGHDVERYGNVPEKGEGMIQESQERQGH